MTVPSQASPLPEALPPSLEMIPGDAPAKPRVREPSVQGTESCPGAEILRWRRELRALGGDPRSLDWLLDAAGGLTPSLLQALLLHPERSVTLLTAKRAVEALWRQHVVDAVPLQYSVGHCHWRDVVIGVGPGVLIPRPETELLVDLAMEFWGEAASLSSDGLLWADLGTGSGCLALALALAFPARQGLAVDVSRVALDRAHHNLAVADLLSRVRVVEGHWLQALQPWWGRLALVVANPPYIPSGVVDQLEPVVRDHEPRLALDGGQDGLDCLRDIVASAPQALAPGGWLLLEHHHDQGQRVLDLLAQHGLVDGQSHADLNGHRRFASGRRPFSKADFTSPSRS